MLIDFGIDFEDFMGGYFEKKPLFLRGAFIPPLQPLRIVDDALDVVDPSEEFLKVLKNAERIGQSQLVEEYVDIGVRRRRIRKDELYRHLASDASLVLNRIDLYSQAVSDICLQVSRFAHAQASANAYLSFGREPATDVHWDRHDIFAVQLFGEKRWLIYEPTFELPLNSQVSAGKKAEAPRTPVMDIVLRAGDVLYLPRGWWHRVTPVEDKPTLHLAIGAHTPLLLDYLIWACGNKLPEYLPFRKSVNAIAPGDGQLEQAMAVLMDVLSAPSTFTDFLHRARARERVNSHASLSDALLNGSGDSAGARVLQLNTRYAPGDGALVINGKRHVLAADERIAVDIVASHPAPTTADLLAALSSRCVAGPDMVLASLLRRDVLSYLKEA